MASLIEKIADRYGNGALPSYFQPGNNGEMSPYAQDRVSDFLARAAEQQPQFIANNQEIALSA